MAQDNNILNCRISTSVSSMIGNLTAHYRDFILRKFPPNYFKDVQVSTGVTANQMQDETDVPQKKLPYLFITPNYVIDNGEGMLGAFPSWRYARFYIWKNARGKYFPIFFNDDDNMYLWAVPNRVQVQFETKIKVTGGMRRIDLLHYIRQLFGANEYMFFNNVKLETEIPKPIIAAMMDLKKVDRTNKDSVEEFYDYMKRFSNGYINKKKNLSSGNDVYSFFYGANILIHTESGADGGEHQKKSMVDDDSVVTFTMSYDIWIPSNYVFETKNDIDTNQYMQIDDSEVFINYTRQVKPNQVRGDKVEVVWEECVTDVDVMVDKIELQELFNDEGLADIVDIIRKNNLKEDDYYEVVCYRDNTELIKATDYTFDWTTYELTLTNPLYNYTYAIGIYCNMKLLNELRDLKKE